MLTLTQHSWYLTEAVGGAGSAGISLGDDFAIEADLERPGTISGVYAGPGCDPLQVAAALGFEAAEQIDGQQEAIAIPRDLPRAGLLAAKAATLKRLLEVPVLRAARSSWAAQLALCASELAGSGLDPGDLLADSLRRLPQLVGPAGLEALAKAHNEEHLAEAVLLGVEALDPLEEDWLWFAGLAEDLPDSSLDLVADLENTPPPDQPAQGALSSTAPGVEALAPVPVFRGEPERASRTGRSPFPLNMGAAPMRVPLYWDLIDDDGLLPENDGFAQAVHITFNGRPSYRLSHPDSRELGVDAHFTFTDPPSLNEAIVQIAHPAQGRQRPALYVRIVCGGEVCCIGALLADDKGWRGTIPFPEGYDSETHEFEVVSSIMRSKAPLRNHRLAEAHQQGLVQVGYRNAPSHLRG